MADNSDLNSLEKAKHQAEATVRELEDALAKAKEIANKKIQEIDDVLKTSKISEDKKGVSSESKSVMPVDTSKAETPRAETVKPDKPQKEAIKKKAEVKTSKDAEKLERKKKQRAHEEKQLENLKVAISNRTKGKVAAEPGNDKVKHTACEVFIFCVDDNQLQLKVLLEQFKNTRSFKRTKGFTNGADLLKYLKTRKFPKKSIILIVMDYFLENTDDEEAKNGISVLADIKEYDPDIEVIMLSSSEDVDIAASASHFGAVTFIKKGNDAFKKVVNNIVWTIREKEQVRKKADTKQMVKSLIIGFALIIISLIAIDYFADIGIGFYPQEKQQQKLNEQLMESSNGPAENAAAPADH